MGHFRVLRMLEDLSRDSTAKPENYLLFKRAIKDFKTEAIAYSVKYQILSEYTAFIAVGKELVDE